MQILRTSSPASKLIDRWTKGYEPNPLYSLANVTRQHVVTQPDTYPHSVHTRPTHD